MGQPMTYRRIALISQEVAALRSVWSWRATWPVEEAVESLTHSLTHARVAYTLKILLGGQALIMGDIRAALGEWEQDRSGLAGQISVDIQDSTVTFCYEPSSLDEDLEELRVWLHQEWVRIWQLIAGAPAVTRILFLDDREYIYSCFLGLSEAQALELMRRWIQSSAEVFNRPPTVKELYIYLAAGFIAHADAFVQEISCQVLAGQVEA